MSPKLSTQISDPLDVTSDPIAAEPFVEGKLEEDVRPGDENQRPVPMDQDPEVDPRKVRTETGDDDISPDDSR